MKENDDKPVFKVGFWFLAILLISLIIRLEYRNSLIIENPVRGDAFYYLSYAHNMVTHNVFAKEPTFNSDKIPDPDSFWAPGFPFLLSSAIRIGSDNFYPVATLYNAILGALLAPMIFYLCVQFLPVFPAIAASLLTAFSPHLISIGSYLLTETLFSFLIIASFLFFIMGDKKIYILCYALSGFLMGLACLTNPVIFFFPFLVVISSYLRLKYFDKVISWVNLKPVFVYLVFFVLVTGCWEARNCISVNKDSKSATSRAAINIINGLYPDYHYAFVNGITKNPDYLMNKDIERTGGLFFKSLIIAAEKIFKQPGKYLSWYLIEKPVVFWGWDIHIGVGDVYVYPVRQSLFTISPLWGNIKSVFQYMNPVFIFVDIIGLLIALKLMRSGKIEIHLLLSIILVLYSTILYSIFYPDPRYSIPFRPFYYILFIWTLFVIFERCNVFLVKRNIDFDLFLKRH